MKKVKLSELPTATSTEGLWLMVTDSNNKSVKVSLESIINAVLAQIQPNQQS